MIYYVCIRWYFIKKKTRIIEIQRQVNDSVDNDRLNSALGILLHPVLHLVRGLFKRITIISIPIMAEVFPIDSISHSCPRH